MNRLLYLGCTPGEDVRLLQNDLNAVTALPSQKSGLAPLVADCAFGSKTGARVQEFQWVNGLTADGVVGPKTLDALHSALQEVPGGAGYSPCPPPGILELDLANVRGLETLGAACHLELHLVTFRQTLEALR